ACVAPLAYTSPPSHTSMGAANLRSASRPVDNHQAVTVTEPRTSSMKTGGRRARRPNLPQCDRRHNDPPITGKATAENTEPAEKYLALRSLRTLRLLPLPRIRYCDVLPWVWASADDVDSKSGSLTRGRFRPLILSGRRNFCAPAL